MATKRNCRIGNERMNITISVLPDDDGHAAIKSELVLGSLGSIQTLGYKVVPDARIRGELETSIGKAWKWFKVTGIRFPQETMLRSLESVVTILNSVRET